MKTSEFDYELPTKLIAQHPPEERGTTKLLVLEPGTGEIFHKKYADIPDYVEKGDVIVLNRTKVLKARVHAQVTRTGRKVEVLFLEKEDDDFWYCLVGRARHVKIGDELKAGDHVMKIIKRSPGEKGFHISIPNAYELMKADGAVPLPPYIDRPPVPDDDARYNTVFSDKLGSVAAPTASLNLTERSLDAIRSIGATIAYVDLHVGLGTFSPVSTEKIEDHVMHEEYVTVSESTAKKVNSCKGKVWAFGTTVVRALESAADRQHHISPFEGRTGLFIYPGYEFKIVDVLVTNFHMPRTSLIMLVSAFAGKENVMSAYAEAIEKDYRFLSYGDSMLVGRFAGAARGVRSGA